MRQPVVSASKQFVFAPENSQTAQREGEATVSTLLSEAGTCYKGFTGSGVTCIGEGTAGMSSAQERARLVLKDACTSCCQF